MSNSIIVLDSVGIPSSIETLYSFDNFGILGVFRKFDDRGMLRREELRLDSSDVVDTHTWDSVGNYTGCVQSRMPCYGYQQPDKTTFSLTGLPKIKAVKHICYNDRNEPMLVENVYCLQNGTYGVSFAFNPNGILRRIENRLDCFVVTDVYKWDEFGNYIGWHNANYDEIPLG